MAKKDSSGCGCIIGVILIVAGVRLLSINSQAAGAAALAVGVLLLVLTIRNTKGSPAKPSEPARTDLSKPTRPWHSVHKKHTPKPFVENLKVKTKPYALARFIAHPMGTDRYYWDGRVGEDAGKLTRFGLPRLQTPEDIALWLKIPLRTLAWLGDYHRNNAVEKVQKKQHYHYKFVSKRSGKGQRLIEAPKPILKTIQNRILHEILDRVPAHAAAHGCVKGRSIQSNAARHTGKYAVIKVDLENFYPKIRFKRVVTVFRGMGYCNEAAHWLARLCTNRVPHDFKLPNYSDEYYRERHLPQGAPTSPMLSNLAAFPLDIRMSGLAKKFGVTYTRYVDDMTFSADEKFMRGKSSNWLIRYIKGIIRDEKFTWNGAKKKIIRRGQRQIVTGLTVNQKPNVSRKEFDRLKAILNNCAHKGPATQNRDKHENFQAHLRGRIAFVASINPEKAQRLQKVFDRIVWSKA